MNLSVQGNNMSYAMAIDLWHLRLTVYSSHHGLTERPQEGILCVTNTLPPLALSPRRTLEDKLLKFIEGHTPHIWAAIAVITAVVVWAR